MQTVPTGHYGSFTLRQLKSPRRNLSEKQLQYWRGTFARLFHFKPGIELSWFPGRD